MQYLHSCFNKIGAPNFTNDVISLTLLKTKKINNKFT